MSDDESSTDREAALAGYAASLAEVTSEEKRVARATMLADAAAISRITDPDAQVKFLGDTDDSSAALYYATYSGIVHGISLGLRLAGVPDQYVAGMMAMLGNDMVEPQVHEVLATLAMANARG